MNPYAIALRDDPAPVTQPAPGPSQADLAAAAHSIAIGSYIAGGVGAVGGASLGYMLMPKTPLAGALVLGVVGGVALWLGYGTLALASYTSAASAQPASP